MYRVLIVNDSKFEAIVMKDILGKLGYSVKIASELDVIKEAKLFLPDLIFVNYIMEKTRGDLLIDSIKNQYQDVLCILTSSNALDLKNFRSRHVDAIINTPKDLQQLDKILKALTEKTEKESDSESVPKSEDSIIANALRKHKADNHVKSIHKEKAVKEFCPFCGQKLGEMFEKKCLFCPYCGSRVSDEQKEDSIYV